jgi:diguanylate cyclase (GGDEF)-like protein
MNIKIKSSFTLRQVLTIPYVILILTLALTIGTLSYFAGSRAVDTVSSQLLLETLGRIGQAVDRHIVGSGAVLEAAFPDGMPVAPSIDEDLETLRTRFWIATSLHLDPNNYVYFGNRIGQGIGLFRHSRTEGELRVKLNAEDMRSFYRFSGIGGKLGQPVHEAKLFDPRERPWYKAGANESRHTWTSVYIDFITEDLVATRARRVLGSKGEFEGVVATDVSLRALNDFVSKLHVSPNGVAFIVEPNGDLIASSASRNVKTMADGSKTRVSADLSGNPLVTAIHSEVKARLPKPGVNASGGAKLRAQPFKFTAPDGQVIHGAFDRLKDDAGLQWITVVAMPRSDFMAGVTDNVIRTVILSALAALIAIAIGMRILNLLSRDLTQLSEAANRVGQGQLNWPIGIKRPDEIGRLARSFESMQQRLQTDELTMLANREAFMLRLRQKVAQAAQTGSIERFAVLFIDLNHFKHINDNYGHVVGDGVLIEVAHRLRTSVRSHDMVARLAGDEFVVLLDQVNDRESLERVRGQIQAALKEPLMSLGKDSFTALDFGGSVGEAMYPDDGQDAESLIRKADRRMYGQKFANRPPGSVPLRRASDPAEAD